MMIFDLQENSLQEVEEYIGINLKIIFEDEKFTDLLIILKYQFCYVGIFRVYRSELNKDPYRANNDGPFSWRVYDIDLR